MIINRTEIQIVDEKGLIVDHYYEYESSISVKRMVPCDVDECEYAREHFVSQMKSDMEDLLDYPNTTKFIDNGIEVRRQILFKMVRDYGI